MIRPAMQRTMQSHCAVFRDGPLMEQGLVALDDVTATMRDDLRRHRSLDDLQHGRG